MSGFNGFPKRMDFTPVPNIFINKLLPEIGDIAELKILLHIFRILYYKKGVPKYLTLSELLNEESVMESINELGADSPSLLKRILESLRKGKIILQINSAENEGEDIYMLNNEKNREVAARIINGEIKIEGIQGSYVPVGETPEEYPNIFTRYEENIGMITPMIAEQLRDAEKIYPKIWIEDAIKEAVNAGKRNWRYISSILERWETEGKSNGTHLRNFKKTDPDKYIKGKYGHTVRR